MKPIHLTLLLFSSFLILLVSKPLRTKIDRQAQEEAPYLEVRPNTFSIRYEIKKTSQRGIADVLWFQKAAQAAIELESPWFNVLEQKISSNAVEGIIELEADPMKAEYDANEILSLQLFDEELNP